MKSQTPKPVLSRKGSSAIDFSVPLASSQTAKVLIVDEDEEVLHLLSTSLARSGFSVTAVFGGEQAWEMLQLENYDLFVTNSQIIGSNLIGRIREAGMSLPVIMASDSFSGNTARDFPQLQIMAMIPKRFEAWNLTNPSRNTFAGRRPNTRSHRRPGKFRQRFVSRIHHRRQRTPAPSINTF